MRPPAGTMPPQNKPLAPVHHLDSVSLRHAIDEYRTFSMAADPLGVDAFTSDCLNRWTTRWGSSRLHGLRADVLHQYFGELCRSGSSAPDISREKGLLASFCRWTERRYSGGDAATSHGCSLTIWNAVEQRRLLDSCRGLERGSQDPSSGYLYALVLLGLKTGLRFQDLLRLEWRHVKGAFDRIHLPADEAWTRRALEIPLQRDAGSLLAALQRRSTPASRASGILAAMGVPLLGSKPDLRRIREDFAEARARAGIRAGDLESLRLTFIRNCASAGIPMADAARLSDCRNRGLLARIYSPAEKARRG